MIFKDNTTNGVCNGCGQCCSSLLPLTDKDVKRIKYLIRSKKLIPARSHNKLEIIDFCPFLTTENRCSIYKDRPAICKHFQCNKAGREKPSSQEIADTKGAVPFNVWDFF